MKNEKIYKSLTKGEVGIYVGASADPTDGRIIHTLMVDGEERPVAESTFKRWWKLVEEVHEDDVQDSVETLTEVVKPATIEELKDVNPEGEDLTDEEIQQFKDAALLKELNEVKEQHEEKPEEKPKEKPDTERKQNEDSGVIDFIQQQIYELGGSFALYSEPAKRVVKNKNGKTVMFYLVKRGMGAKLYMKEQLDEALFPGVQAEEKYTYPKQFPFRLEVTNLTDENKVLLSNILKIYV